jgi:hypothetical protein
MKKYFYHTLVFALIIGMTACGSKKDSEGSESDEFKEAQAAQGDASKNFDDIIENIPPPTEIPYLLLSTGADFNENVINPYTNVDSYLTTEETKALNLGVYAADLGYLSSYDKTQDALNYLTSMKKLADDMGVATAYDIAMMNRFEKNLGNQDSMYNIINQGVSQADIVLKSSDRGNIAAMLTVGSFIEGLYIGTQLIEQYPQDLLTEEQKYTVLTPLIRVILEQENSLSDVVNLASSVPQDGKMKEIVVELKVLQEAFAALDVDEKIAANKGDELMNDNTLKEIIDQISKIRNQITG